MHMSFWFGYADIQMIFTPWIINDIPNLIGSCTGLFMISIIYECLKTYRDVKTDQLNKQFDVNDADASFADSRSGLDQPIDRSDSDQELIDSGTFQRGQGSVLFNPTHILLSVTYFVQQFIGLCLMLLFMTFNMYICLAICAGQAVGYYFTGYIRIAHRIKSAQMDCH